MNKEENKIVPQLRFPEFENKGKWNNQVIGEFISETQNIADKALPLYSLTIEDGVVPKSKRYERSFLVKDKLDAYKIVLNNDFVYNPMNLRFGAIAKYNGSEQVAVSKYYNIFNCDGSVDSDFCEFYFKSYPMITYYNDVATGSLIEKRRVHFSEFIKFNIPFPEFEEQQKIANCLSSLDDVINAETEKLDLLQDHKKGLLQQLFPQQGESQPKYRFPEFMGDGDWVTKELSVALKGKSSQIAKNKLDIIEKGFAVYGADGMLGYIDSYTQKEDYIAIVKDGSGVGNIFYCEGKSSLLGTLNYLVPKNEEKYKLKWLYYLLQTISFKPFIKGSGIPHIYFKDYSKLLVSYPKPMEQQKIANCLTSVDELIASQQQKIEGLKAHKKGLLQKLFPKIE